MHGRKQTHTSVYSKCTTSLICVQFANQHFIQNGGTAATTKGSTRTSVTRRTKADRNPNSSTSLSSSPDPSSRAPAAPRPHRRPGSRPCPPPPAPCCPAARPSRRPEHHHALRDRRQRVPGQHHRGPDSREGRFVTDPQLSTQAEGRGERGPLPVFLTALRGLQSALTCALTSSTSRTAPSRLQGWNEVWKPGMAWWSAMELCAKVPSSFWGVRAQSTSLSPTHVRRAASPASERRRVLRAGGQEQIRVLTKPSVPDIAPLRLRFGGVPDT